MHSFLGKTKTGEAHKSNREPPLLPVYPCLLLLRRMKAMPGKACTYSHSVLPPQTQLFGYSENRRVGQPTPFPPSLLCCLLAGYMPQQASSPPASHVGASSSAREDRHFPNKLDATYVTSILHQLRNRTICL